MIKTTSLMAAAASAYEICMGGSKVYGAEGPYVTSDVKAIGELFDILVGEGQELEDL